MPFPPHYFIALGSAVGYACATLLGKRATQEGAGALLLAVAGIIAHPLCFWPMLLIRGTEADWSLVHWPLLAAATMAGGFVCVAGAIKLGDVSIQTPIAGTKALFVAAIVGFFTAASVPVSWWIAAVMTAIGVAIIGLPELRSARGSTPSVLLALLSAGLFGVTDSLVQTHAPDFGPEMFIMVVLSGASVLVGALIPVFRPRLGGPARRVWPWLLAFAVLMGMQGAAFGLTLAIWGDATALNIVYATRGFWSIALVWLFASRLAVPEADRSWKTMSVRLTGAALLFGAVVLVLMSGGESA